MDLEVFLARADLIVAPYSIEIEALYLILKRSGLSTS
jgi:hypothetical protein